MTRKRGVANILLYFSVMMGIMLVLGLALVIAGFSDEGLYFTVFSLTMYATGIVLVVFNRDFLKKQFKTNYRKKETYVYGIIGGVLALGLSFISTYIFGLIDPSVLQNPVNQVEIENMIENAPKFPVVLLIAFAVPLIEEIVFRAGMMGILLGNKIGKTYLPYIISAFIFTFIHDITLLTNPLELQSLYFFLMYFITALILGVTYKKTKHNLLAVYIIHMINNLVGCIEIFI